jgi:GNAT superfamily N-acetyltransferase
VTFEAARPATAADLDRLDELAELANAELGGQRGGRLWAVRDARLAPYHDAFAALVGAPDALVLAGTFDEVVVGFAAVELEPLRDGTILALLRDIYVEPPARGVGVGEALIEAVLAWCEARGCRGIDSLVLPGNRESKNFFERFGLTARAIVVHRPLGRHAHAPEADGAPA